MVLKKKQTFRDRRERQTTECRWAPPYRESPLGNFR